MAVMDSDLDGDWDMEIIMDTILITVQTITMDMILSTIITGIHRFSSTLVSETGGTIIITVGIATVITMIITITGILSIHIMVMEIITDQTDIQIIHK